METSLVHREQSVSPPGAGGFVSRSQVMGPADITRAITRISHEIVERNQGAEVHLVALQTGGVLFARRLADSLTGITGNETPMGTLDVAEFRDDAAVRANLIKAETDIPFDLDGKRVVIVDDVLFTGRTVRAALYALNSFGRSAVTQLAVMVDRGHRELPIRPDFVGKNLPTRLDEQVEVDIESGVRIGETGVQ